MLMTYKKAKTADKKVIFPDCIDEYVEVMPLCVCLMYL